MRLRLAAGVALLTGATVLSGCGQAEQVMRKLDVKDAAAWIEKAPAVRATISLDAEPSALAALVEEHGDSAGLSGTPLGNPGVLEAIAGARLVVVGTPSGSGTPGALTAASLQADGAEVAGLVLGGGSTFARIDPEALTAHLPAGSPLAGKDLAGLALALDLVAPGTGGLLRGGWMAADSDAAAEWAGPRFAGLLAGGEQAMPAVARGFETVVRRATILEDPADPAHTTMTISGDDLRDVLGERSPAGLPSQIVLDAYTADGRLARLSIDLTQFPGGGEARRAGSPAPDPVRLDVRLEEAQPVLVPSGARRLDLARLPTLTRLLALARRLPEPWGTGARP